MSSESEASSPESEFPQRKIQEPDEAPSTTGDKKKPIKGLQIHIPKDSFVTNQALSGAYRARFQILPFSRHVDPENDKLAACIENGGGLIVGESDDPSSDKGLIRILDIQFIRANAIKTMELILPHDCFSSNFVWNQVIQRSKIENSLENRNANLNLFRVSPSAYEDYDACGIFQGSLTWDKLKPLASLPPTARIKEVVMHLYPELLLFTRSNGSFKVRSRRCYTRHEGQLLLDKICEMDGHDRTAGVTLYQEIVKTGHLSRSHVSLREHFRKTILPHVLMNDGYYTVDKQDLKKFQAAYNENGSKARKKRKISESAATADLENLEEEEYCSSTETLIA